MKERGRKEGRGEKGEETVRQDKEGKEMRVQEMGKGMGKGLKKVEVK